MKMTYQKTDPEYHQYMKLLAAWRPSLAPWQAAFQPYLGAPIRNEREQSTSQWGKWMLRPQTRNGGGSPLYEVRGFVDTVASGGQECVSLGLHIDRLEPYEFVVQSPEFYLSEVYLRDPHLNAPLCSLHVSFGPTMQRRPRRYEEVLSIDIEVYVETRMYGWVRQRGNIQCTFIKELGVIEVEHFGSSRDVLDPFVVTVQHAQQLLVLLNAILLKKGYARRMCVTRGERRRFVSRLASFVKRPRLMCAKQ